MFSSSLIGLLATAVLLNASAFAQPAKKPTQRAAKASPAAPIPEVQLTPGQLEAANRVLTGSADCEFRQTVQLTAIDGRAGHFKLVFGKLSYTLVAQETTTGAVRLEDHKAGVVWLQIPAKSMLLNTKVGQRMVDSCVHEQQRFAVAPANSSLGIEEAPPEPSDPTVPGAPTVLPGPPAPTVPTVPTVPTAPAAPAAPTVPTDTPSVPDPEPAPPPAPL